MNFQNQLKIFSFACALILPGIVSAQTNSYEIRCRTVNGTTGKPQKSEKAVLVLMKNIPETIAEIQNPGPQFQFTLDQKPIFPLLIKVIYKNTEFSEVIASESGILNSVTVFEPGAASEDISIKSVIQIIKKRDSLHVTEIYSVNNRSMPPRVFQSENLYFLSPQPAENLKIMVQHEKTSVARPVSFKIINGKKRISHDFSPGFSGFSAEYEVPDHAFSDGLLYHGDASGNVIQSRAESRIVLWQPNDAEPEITGGMEVRSISFDRDRALQVDYSTDSRLKYSLDRGGYVIDSSFDSWRNPIFDSIHKSLIGIVLFFGIFVLILFYAVRQNVFLRKN